MQKVNRILFAFMILNILNKLLVCSNTGPYLDEMCNVCEALILFITWSTNSGTWEGIFDWTWILVFLQFLCNDMANKRMFYSAVLQVSNTSYDSTSWNSHMHPEMHLRFEAILNIFRIYSESLPRMNLIVITPFIVDVRIVSAQGSHSTPVITVRFSNEEASTSSLAILT